MLPFNAIATLNFENLPEKGTSGKRNYHCWSKKLNGRWLNVDRAFVLWYIFVLILSVNYCIRVS